MAEIRYDPTIIEEAARQLYKQAGSIVAGYTLLGAVGGAILGLAVGSYAGLGSGVAIMAAMMGAVVGWVMAQPRAFLLRLQAQQALCQVQIEKNTRTSAAGSTQQA